MGGMSDIHGKFGTVSKSSLPLVSLSNQTSVELLSADKSFKDFLTTENKQRMDEMRQEFARSQQRFESTLAQLETASQIYPSLAEPFSQLKTLEQSYFTEALEAMDNYEAMFAAQEKVHHLSPINNGLPAMLSVIIIALPLVYGAANGVNPSGCSPSSSLMRFGWENPRKIRK